MLAIPALLVVGSAATAIVFPARRICRPGPAPNSNKAKHKNVLIIGDSLSLGAMGDVTPLLAAGGANAEHAPWSGDGGALDVKYAMDTSVVMTGAGTGPPWRPKAFHPDAVRYGDGCLNGTFLVTNTQQPTKYDLISFNYGVHDVDYSGYDEEYVPLPLYEASIRAVKRTLQATGAMVLFQTSTPVEYNLTTNARILAYNAAAVRVMAEDPPAAINDLYKTITDICGQPPYNAPSIKGSPNCSISDYNGVHYHAGGWAALANSSAHAILALLKSAPQPTSHPPPATLATATAPPIQCAAPAAASTSGGMRGVVAGHDFDESAWSVPAEGEAPKPPTSCPANSTCMVTAFSTTGMGCCMGYGPKAVACGDHVHCCPEGWSCSSECRLGGCTCIKPPEEEQHEQAQKQDLQKDELEIRESEQLVEGEWSSNRPSPTKCQNVTDGSFAPCGPGNDLCHSPGYGHNAPQYHVRDESCAMNDPAAVIYDPVHALYHDHWEDHLAMPGGQYVRGHAVSRDLIHWAHLPVSLWNDRPYDNWAIFTGSATLVDGKVVQIYPGLCKPVRAGTTCPGATNLAIAVPEDPTDPFQTNWTKDGKVGNLVGYTNPIANNTGRDPSTAWQTPAGEWRITSYGSQIFGSMDFKAWYPLGHQESFPAGECPSFFPLPATTTPGSGPAPPDAATPTHVYKSSHGGKDWMTVGSYVAGPPKQLGTFTALGPQVLIDHGAFYASKDFYDPVGKRRINWGWAQIAYGPWNDGNAWESSCHTLPREVTWNAELQQLVFSPLAEQAKLRGSPSIQLKAQPLTSNRPVSLGAGNQSEIVVSFARPTSAVTLMVTVMAGSDGKGVTFTIEYKPPSSALVDEKSGASVVTVACPSARATDSLKLSPNDKTLDVRVFVDNVMSEVYFMGGRVAMTVPSFTPKHAPATGPAISVDADGAGADLVSATVWPVQSIWVSKEQVLATPRLDLGEENAELMAARIHAQQRSR